MRQPLIYLGGLQPMQGADVWLSVASKWKSKEKQVFLLHFARFYVTLHVFKRLSFYSTL